MPDDIEFIEEKDSIDEKVEKIKSEKQPAMRKVLMKTGLGKRRADVLLVVISIIFFILAFFFFALGLARRDQDSILKKPSLEEKPETIRLNQ